MLSQTPEGYKNLKPLPYYRELVRSVEALPGMRAVAMTDFAPFFNFAYRQPVAALDAGSAGQEAQAHVAKVTDGFFAAVGMTIVSGRDFRRDETAEPVAIISQSLAARFGDPSAMVGRHIRIGTTAEYQRLTVVGVASDAQFDLSDPAEMRPPAVYVNAWQYPAELAGYPVLVVKTGGGLSAALMRQTVSRLGREYVQRIHTLSAEIDGALVENRLTAYLSGTFGLLALVLAATGLFGLLSYQVANRTGEIGIRLALGARRGQIQWLMVRQAASLVVGGCAAGLALADLTGRAIGGLLFGVEASDARLLAASTAILALTALAAAWLPARRAASVDPLVALRHE
jgi:ABC-type antimicrobial peptide transport system permease subunit